MKDLFILVSILVLTFYVSGEEPRSVEYTSDTTYIEGELIVTTTPSEPVPVVERINIKEATMWLDRFTEQLAICRRSIDSLNVIINKYNELSNTGK
jgi:hypothetical protein